MNNNMINIVSRGGIRFNDRFFDIKRFRDTIESLRESATPKAPENSPEYTYFWYLRNPGIVNFLDDGTLFFNFNNSGAFTGESFMNTVKYLSRFCKENCYHDMVVAGLSGSLMKENRIRITFDPNSKKSGYIVRK
jgi:hypothetical protein